MEMNDFYENQINFFRKYFITHFIRTSFWKNIYLYFKTYTAYFYSKVKNILSTKACLQIQLQVDDVDKPTTYQATLCKKFRSSLKST